MGGDLSFLIESKEQLSKVMQMGSDCRILCMESQNNETRDLYKKLVDANVLIRTYGTKKNDFLIFAVNLKIITAGKAVC